MLQTQNPTSHTRKQVLNAVHCSDTHLDTQQKPRQKPPKKHTEERLKTENTQPSQNAPDSPVCTKFRRGEICWRKKQNTPDSPVESVGQSGESVRRTGQRVARGDPQRR